MTSLVRKHIADPANANSTIQEHWGYVQRILPCTNDAGSCEYLDAVYWMHDISMLYTFILWAVIGFVLVLISMLKVCIAISFFKRCDICLSRGFRLPFLRSVNNSFLSGQSFCYQTIGTMEYMY